MESESEGNAHPRRPPPPRTLHTVRQTPLPPANYTLSGRPPSNRRTCPSVRVLHYG